MPQTREHGEIETVVRNHAGWVHACACRRVGDEAMAEDVTQAVFILFWRKRGRLGKEVKLTGWLYRAVRYCAARALRVREVRERYEREAAMAGSREKAAGNVGWSEVSPELEAAVDRLGDRYREVVLLRFYRQMSFIEVAQALGLSEEAARKRVQRALEKLREVLGKKGMKGTTAGLSAVLVGNVVGQMPEGLAERIVSAVGSGSGNIVAAAIAKGAIKMTVKAKVMMASAVVATGLLAGGTIVGVVAVVGVDSAAQPTTVASREGNLPESEFLRIISFPKEYDGKPAAKCPAELRDKIIAVHKRYWANYTSLRLASFQFSYHRYIDGKPSPLTWDMDAKVEVEPGQGMKIEGKDASGSPFSMVMTREGVSQSYHDNRNWAEFMLDVTSMRMAKPEWCSLFTGIEENMSMEGAAPGDRFDVLSVDSSYDTQEGEPVHPGWITAKYWFNRSNGMLERIERCDPQTKARFGRYSIESFKYTKVNGIYFVTEHIDDGPARKLRVEHRCTALNISRGD